MQLYCYHTPSHDYLFERFFLPTLKDEFEVVNLRDSKQWCISATFRRSGWRHTQCQKLRTWIAALNASEIFIGADVDIQWFRNTKEAFFQALGDNDLAVQTYPDGSICSGLFICRSNDATKKMWNSILTALERGDDNGEQSLLISHLLHGDVSWGALPPNEFWSPSIRYTTLDQIIVPAEILLHHATFTKGIKNKIEQLEYVRKCFNAYNTGFFE